MLTDGRKARTNRTRMANPAAFEAVEMKAVIGVGAPSYTSGVQKWNGTAATLNPNPVRIKITAPLRNQGEICPIRILSTSTYNAVSPVTPYSRLNPYSITAEVNAPKRK